MLEYDFISWNLDQYVIKKNDEAILDCSKIFAVSPSGRNIQQSNATAETCSTVIDYEHYNFGSYAGMYRWVYLDDTNETACAYGADNTDIAISNCIASGSYVDRVIYSNGHNYSPIYLEVEQKLQTFKSFVGDAVFNNLGAIIGITISLVLVFRFIKETKKQLGY